MFHSLKPEDVLELYFPPENVFENAEELDDNGDRLSSAEKSDLDC